MVSHAFAFMPQSLSVELVTVAQAAEIVGLSRVRIRVLVASGVLPAEKVGRDWLIRRSVVEKFARKERRGPGRPRKEKARG
jgi:excisionase family DNA binding protein